MVMTMVLVVMRMVVIVMPVTMRMTVIIVGMIVIVAMTVIMAVTVLLIVMIATMMMIVAGADIGAAFRIERRLDLDDAGAEAFHHLLDYMVTADSQVFSRNLHRQVAIAEMPGEPHHLPEIDAAKLDQRLRRRDHLDEPAIFKHQGVAATQRDRLRQVEQEFQAARAGHSHATPVAVVELQYDRIGGCVAPAVCRPD